MRRHFVLLSVAVTLVGCGTAERHRIRPVTRMTTEASGSLLGGGPTPAVAVSGHGGVWLTRFVEKPDSLGGERALEAIEILFCPSLKSSISRCRVGVAWARQQHPMTERARPTEAPDLVEPPAAQLPDAVPPGTTP